MPYTFSFIGAGNMSWSLIPALQKAGHHIIQLISRSEEKLEHFAATYNIPIISTNLQDLNPKVDFVFLTVSDQAVEKIAKTLPKTNATFLHTSGSISLESLSPIGEHIGVFYPMQTFTRQKLVDFYPVPIFLEGKNETVEKRLYELAQTISNNVQFLNSQDRLRLHMGAVISCNFTNYLYQLTNKVLPHQAGLDFSIYTPLLREQLDKALAFQPQHTQTGPAIRGDIVTLQKHLTLLKDQPEIRELYLKLSNMINPGIKVQVSSSK